MSENTTAMKQVRSYERLLCAILEQKPAQIIESLLFEYCACDYKYALLTEGDQAFNDYKEKVLAYAKLDAKNYFSHRQGGRSTLVHKDSPLGRKLSKGAFAPSNEES